MRALFTQETGDGAELLTVRNIIVFVSALVLACFYDLLFYRNSVGISYPIFILLTYAVVYINTAELFVKKWCFGWFLGIPVAALALTYLFFSNEVLRNLNALAMPILFAAHIVLVTGRNRFHWFESTFLRDICWMLIVNPIKYSLKPFLLLFALLRESQEMSRFSTGKKIMTGVVLSLPVLAVVVLLLASADPVFSRLVGKVRIDMDAAEFFQHTWLIGVITIITFGYLWGLTKEETGGISPPSAPKKFDEMMILPGLFLLNAIYGVFVCIQFSYLFGSIANFLPEGLTYAEYARRGFWELIAVALINSVIVLGSLTYTQISGTVFRRILQSLNSVLLISTFVMLLSAHTRMSFYEDAFGYTYLRVFTHAFMAMLLFMLGVTFYKVWIERINLAQWYIIIGLISYIAINYINVDILIAERNYERYEKTGEIDVNYLAGMSYDTTPYLAMLAGDQNQEVALAASKAVTQRKTELSAKRGWQSYNLSEQRARKYLAETVR